ncbi:response regulator receiver modulated FAD-dependent pyridine nucleotide-disulfide oxidoreductase (plasmid) [Scytonema sp. HK-05]|uniref:FAD-dependent oxidoreductase n=1 Tax=Scytonema sp. HK-05 TaxID=1137095 RepID=UPI000935F77D|nr:FAD-dependent oxidoreductase [Scytonema sp. HK-05]OKH59414.1 fused response regulator/thioredoxin-disulfide reductase [Scytonema sp. HK-05]BAY50084.1 response regulator receiver modulated FAD-dependent pyridine nucleotide-disulfide oxidoreductase [Scytonema sp. HK-05]
MAKPVILILDDDSEVLQALEHDLRSEYGNRFRLLRANSALMALEVLKKLKLRNDSAALFLVDQRMPQMTGVEFLEQAMEIFPTTKRVLLTAYADTNAAIHAINKAKIDYYLLKPWNPPQERLYPMLNDLLEVWQASFRPPFEGVRVIGSRWSPKLHQAKDFLARNHIPYQWLNIESEEAHSLISYTNCDIKQLPVVLFSDGSHLVEPTNIQIAEKIGLKTRPKMPFYDLVIVGAGPAGLAAAVYGASEGLRTVLIEREAPGGQAGTSSRIENYLGFPSGLTGGDLAQRAVAQAQKFRTEILSPQEVTDVRLHNQYRFITLADGSELSTHTLIIATGVSYRKLNVPGSERLTGAGVYYGAAITEALSCQGEDVFVIGAGNSAGQAAMYLSKYAGSVTIVARGDSLKKSMSQYLIEQIEETENIAVKLSTQVIELLGKEKLEAVAFSNLITDEVEILPTNALFNFIGAKPHTDWLESVVERDEHGFIFTGVNTLRNWMPPKGWTLERSPFFLETSVPGIFAIGDVRHQSVKRVASAVGEGAIAVQLVHQYLASL